MTVEFEAAIKVPILNSLYQYWRGRLDDRGVFLRSQLNPADIVKILPYTFIMDVLHDDVGQSGRFRYRLTGTVIDELVGGQVVGLTLEDFRKGPMLEHLTALFGECSDGWTPGYSVSNLKGESSETMLFQRLVLPMSLDGTRVDQLLGGCSAHFSHSTAKRSGSFQLENFPDTKNQMLIYSNPEGPRG